jgi:hypothetical protein
MVGHWVGNVFVMCWSKKSRIHEMSDKCDEIIKNAIQLNNEIVDKHMPSLKEFQLSLDKIRKKK